MGVGVCTHIMYCAAQISGGREEKEGRTGAPAESGREAEEEGKVGGGGLTPRQAHKERARAGATQAGGSERAASKKPIGQYPALGCGDPSRGAVDQTPFFSMAG